MTDSDSSFLNSSNNNNAGSGSGVNASSTNVSSILSPSEIAANRSKIESLGINAYIHDALSLMLSQRPSDPLAFMADYFRRAAFLSSSSSSGSNSNDSKSISKNLQFSMIKRSLLNQDKLIENIAQAYIDLVSSKSNQFNTSRSQSSPDDNRDDDHDTPPVSLAASEYIDLLRSICHDFPIEIIDSVLHIVGKSMNDSIEFPVFLQGICTCMKYHYYFRKIDFVFQRLRMRTQTFSSVPLPPSSKDRIPKKVFLQVLKQVHTSIQSMNSEDNDSNVPVPSDSQLMSALRIAGINTANVNTTNPSSSSSSSGTGTGTGSSVASFSSSSDDTISYLDFQRALFQLTPIPSALQSLTSSSNTSAFKRDTAAAAASTARVSVDHPFTI